MNNKIKNNRINKVIIKLEKLSKSSDPVILHNRLVLINEGEELANKFLQGVMDYVEYAFRETSRSEAYNIIVDSAIKYLQKNKKGL